MKIKVSHTLDKQVMEAVHTFATEDERPITDSAALELLVKEALAARGIKIAPAEPATPKRKGKAQA